MSWIKSLLYRIEMPLALRVGISASLALILQGILSQYFHRPDRLISGLWCVVTAIIVSQANLGGTLKAAKNRFLGVFIGCILGCLFTIFFGDNTLSLGVSVGLTVIICSIFNLQDSLRIASLSVAVVMILWGLQSELSPWIFGFYRFIDSCLGIVVAVIVSHLIFPSEATQQMRSTLSDAMQKIENLYQGIISFEIRKGDHLQHSDIEGGEIIGLFAESRRVWEESKLELFMQSASVDSWNFLIHQFERLLELVLSLQAVYNSTTHDILDEGLEHQMAALTKQTSHSMGILSNNLREKNSKPAVEGLKYLLDQLNEELTRFRTTRITRQLDLGLVQNFFVLFYALRAIAEELQSIDSTLKTLNSKDLK